MTDETKPHRHVLKASPADIVARLPSIGKVMIINSQDGITHERIGVIDSLTIDQDWAICSGVDHDSRIHLPSITRMVSDTSSVMREKAYPRIDFYGADNRSIFSAVSFAGLEPFIAALDGVETEIDTEGKNPMEMGERTETSPGDPGQVPLEAAIVAAAPVTILIERPGFSQAWHGVIEKIVPSTGFINVMVPNFHFHLRGGAIGHWQEEAAAEGAVLSAHSADGKPLGLTLRSPSVDAFTTSAIALGAGA